LWRRIGLPYKIRPNYLVSISVPFSPGIPIILIIVKWHATTITTTKSKSLTITTGIATATSSENVTAIKASAHVF
jgi:hypothetical protein